MSKGTLCYIIADEDKEWITPSGKSIADIVLKNYLDIACDKNKLETKNEIGKNLLRIILQS